jgi:MFS family permease
MRLSVADGILYAGMVGIGETYFVAAAVHLRATPLLIGLVSTLPLLVGAIGALLTLRLLRRGVRRRPIAAAGAAGQALIWLMLAWSSYARALAPTGLVVLLCVYQVCAQAAGNAWSSWYGDLVPRGVRGRYFARRTRWMHASTLSALVVGGTVFSAVGDGVDEQAHVGFAVVFLAASLLRAGCAVLLALSPEPAFAGAAPAVRLRRFTATAKGKNALRLVLGGGLFYVAVYASAPFFSPYMLDVLRFDLDTFTLATGVQAIAKVAALHFWGANIDRVGARPAYGFAILLAALVPLPWLWVGGLHGVLWAQVLSGIAWGGYEVTLFALLLDATHRQTRPFVFALQSTVHGSGQVAGSSLGAALVSNLGYGTAFLASFLARTAVALALPLLIADLRRADARRRRPLLLRIIGFRPGAGPVHRPIPEPTGRQRATEHRSAAKQRARDA